MSVKIADKIIQYNNGTYMLMDASAVEYKLANGGTTSVQQALDNGLTGGTVTSNQLSLVANSQYFKISITKNNPAWYGSLKFGYVYGTTLTEVDITITPALNYTISKGPNTISSITYTIDGANITIGIKCTTTVYGTQIVEMPSEFGTINSLTKEEFTGDTTATLKEGDSRGVITSLNALNLTADATVEDVVNALKNGESFLAPVNTFTNYETIFPNRVPNDQWNKIHIIKGTSLASSHIRCFSPSGTSEYLANINNTNIVAWNDVSGTYTDISESIIEKLGNEILKYPVGKYRINSTTSGNKFTDLPSDAEIKCGLIEINGTAVGKSPFTDAWVYRMYKFECLTGTLSYVRRLSSGATAGQIELDTGWCRDGQETYTSLNALKLTADATIDDVINALKEGETALISTNEFTNYKDGMFPSQCTDDHYAVIKVEKESGSKVFLEWRQKAGNAYAIGGLNSSNKFTNWGNLVRFKKDGFADDSIVCIGETLSSDGVIQTLESLGFSNDILTWDTGVYRVSHVSGLINVPSEITSTAPAFRLEHHDCKKWGGNHNPNTNTYAVRHSVLYAEGGNVYHRYYESGKTAGVYANDSGWRIMAGVKHHRIVTQATGGYFKFKICTDPKSQPMRIIATDNYGGRIEITGANSTSYKPFKCVRTSHGAYSSYDASNPANNKMQKLYLYDGYFYLEVLSYSTVTFENLLEAPTYVETLENKDTEIPIIYSGSKTYTGIGQLNSAKGTSIELVANTDNTLKIVEVLDDGEEFVEWFGNSNDRFGLSTNAGWRINYLRIQRTNATNGIILAVTDFGKTFSRVYNAGTLENWCWDKTKATLVTNTTTLKLDVTKRNNSWYGAVKLTYLYDTSPVEIEITFRSATDDVRWALINGQRYIKKITYTQDSSDTKHYTIGIEFNGTTYGNYQAEVIGDFADINSLTNESFTGAKTAVYNAPWGKNNGVTLVTTPEDLKLTFPCTTVQLAQAMRNKFNVGVKCGAIGIFNCEGKTVSITDAPANYGLLHVETFGHDRILIRFDGIDGSSYAGSWIGQIKGSNGTFSGITWTRIDNETRVTTLETQVSELFQSVSDGKTLVANAITGKGVSTSTSATFATMATNISKIPQTITWKEETVSASPDSNTHIARFVFSNTVLGVKQMIAPGYHYQAEVQEKKMFTINSNYVEVYLADGGTWKMTAMVRNT